MSSMPALEVPSCSSNEIGETMVEMSAVPDGVAVMKKIARTERWACGNRMPLTAQYAALSRSSTSNVSEL